MRVCEDDEQFQGDAGADERLLLRQVGERRLGVLRHEELGADDQEAEQAEDAETEVEDAGDTSHGGSSLTV